MHAPAAQHSASTLAPGHADAVQSASHVAQHAAPSHGTVSPGGKGLVSKFRHLRHARPRLHMMVVGSSTAAVVAVGGFAVYKAQADDPPPREAAATTTTVVVTVPSAPVVVTTAAVVTPATKSTTPKTTPATDPVTTEPASTEPATTLPETTTTVLALPSGAGDYTITVGDLRLNGAGLSTSLPSTTQTWTFTGACDGVGDCSISASGGEAVLTTGAGGSIFSGPGSQIALVPAGGGTYTSSFGVDGGDCGTATAMISITVDGTNVSGNYSIGFTGNAACPLTSIGATFNGTRA